MRARAWAHALMAHARRGPSSYIDEGGRDLQLLLGYLDVQGRSRRRRLDRLKPLADDAAFAKRRPAVLYYLARAEYGAGLFEAAVRNMDNYLDAITAPAPAPAP